jgi:hypothetical protein
MYSIDAKKEKKKKNENKWGPDSPENFSITSFPADAPPYSANMVSTPAFAPDAP